MVTERKRCNSLSVHFRVCFNLCEAAPTFIQCEPVITERPRLWNVPVYINVNRDIPRRGDCVSQHYVMTYDVKMCGPKSASHCSERLQLSPPLVKMMELNFEDLMDSSSLWTLIYLLAFLSCSPVTGDFRMISPSQPILAVPGDDVILPCQLDPPSDLERFAVEWLNPDLKPDPSDLQGWVDFVFLYRHRREDLDMKLPLYINRTQLFTEELKHGNISLKILNVTPEDTGRYKCFIPKLKAYSIVQLVVDPDFNTRTTEMPPYPADLQTPDPRDETADEVDQTRHSIWIVPVVFFLLLVLTLVVTGLLIKRQRQKQTQKHDVEGHIALNTPPD